MRILYVVPRYHTNMVPIIEYLATNRHDVHVLAYRTEIIEDYSVVQPQLCRPSIIYKIKEFLFHKKNRSYSAREKYRMSNFMPSPLWLIKYLLNLKPEVVVVRDRKYSSSIVYLISKLCGVKNVILYTQDPCFTSSQKEKKSFKNLIKYIIYPKKTYSPVQFRDSLTHAKQVTTGAHFIPFAMNFDTSIVQGRTYLAEGRINILDVGKYRDYKNHFVLVKAVKTLPQETRKQLHITIIGQVSCEEEKEYRNSLIAFIRDNHLEGVFDILESVPYNKLPEIYLKNDVFILTSKQELASVSVLEAMKYGMVCVSTNKNGTASYINSKLGYIFESDNETSLADVLIEIIKNKDKISILGLDTFQYASQNYSTESYFVKLQNLINE